MEKDYKWQQRLASRNKKTSWELTSLNFFEGQFNGGFSKVFSRFWDSPPLGFHGSSQVGQAVRFNTAEAPWLCRLDDVNQQIYGICFIYVFYVFFCDILWISMMNMMELFDDIIYIYHKYIYIHSIHRDLCIVWIWNWIMCTEQMQIHWSQHVGGLVPWVCQRCGRRSGDWVHPAEW